LLAGHQPPRRARSMGAVKSHRSGSCARLSGSCLSVNLSLPAIVTTAMMTDETKNDSQAGSPGGGPCQVISSSGCHTQSGVALYVYVYSVLLLCFRLAWCQFTVALVPMCAIDHQSPCSFIVPSTPVILRQTFRAFLR